MRPANRTLASDLAGATGGSVVLQGWVHRRRRLASVTFVVLRDRTGLAQVVVREPAALAAVEKHVEETVVEVNGTAVANPQAPGGVEIVDPVFRALGDAADPPPIEL